MDWGGVGRGAVVAKVQKCEKATKVSVCLVLEILIAATLCYNRLAEVDVTLLVTCVLRSLMDLLRLGQSLTSPLIRVIGWLIRLLCEDLPR